MNFESIENAILEMRAGRPVVVVDDEGRENEGDLIIAAERASLENISFMIRYTSGILCVPMLDKQLQALQIPMMVDINTEKHQTAFTVSVDAKHRTTTGISAHDRLQTIQALIHSETKPDDLLRPGHVFPLKYTPGGVLKRAGHTEAGVDLAILAGLEPAAVIAEVMSENGSVAKSGEIEQFAKEHKLCMVSIADLVRYRSRNEKIVKRVSTARIPTEHGEFEAHCYSTSLDDTQHIALVKGDVASQEHVLVRVHSECLTGDVFMSKRCDCGSQLNQALKKIADHGSGVLVYLRGHEGRGIGLEHKLRAYNLQDQGSDTVEANQQLGLPVDSREYGVGAQILADLQVSSMRLMTNNPAKYSGLSGYGLKIVERVPLWSQPNPENQKYLMTKKQKMGHLFQGAGLKGAL